MKRIPSDEATGLWTRFLDTGTYCNERWIHEAAQAAGVGLEGHSVADTTPTLVRAHDEVRAIQLRDGRPFNVLIGHVVDGDFVARSS